MNDIFSDVFGTLDTQKQTPIEIALGVDVRGMTTATKLYEFLELNPSNYAKWFKKNLLENEFAEEKVDFFPFVLQYESLTGEKERQDAKLTASFAKKLSMMQKNKKGEAARKYFIGIENGAKKMTEQVPYILDACVAADVAKLGNTTEHIMDKQGSAPYKIAEAFKMECEQFGIQLPDDFVKVPQYEQLEMPLLE